MEITRCSVKRRSRRSNNSTGSANNNIEIPMDLIFNILLRLPVKPLLRFKSVCKTWYALIQNHSFIKTHHTMSKTNLNNNNNPILPSLLVTHYDSETMMYNTWLKPRDETRHLIYSFKLNRHPQVLGVCDGMLCATCDFGIIICNPTTGGPICKIPRFNLLKVKELDEEFFGFGSLQTQDNNYDYKLFRIICSSHLNYCGAEVYSMSTGIWREIEVTAGANIDPRRDQYPLGVLSNSPPVAINEVFYWRAYVNRIVSVMCFDMRGYVFDTIAGPEKLSSGFCLTWEIVDFKGEVALATCRYNCNNLFEMWVFSKKERSWTMKLSTEDFTSMHISILGYGRNNNLVMLHNSSDAEEENKLFTYDTESLDIVYYDFKGLKKFHSVFLYTESLLLV